MKGQAVTGQCGKEEEKVIAMQCIYCFASFINSLSNKKQL